jgi:hypothetical protein
MAHDKERRQNKKKDQAVAQSNLDRCYQHEEKIYRLHSEQKDSEEF